MNKTGLVVSAILIALLCMTCSERIKGVKAMAAPGSFDLLYPIDTTIGQPDCSIDFSWEESSGADEYKLIIKDPQANEFKRTFQADEICSGGECAVRVCQGDVNYGYPGSWEWKVRAKNADGSTTEGPENFSIALP